MSNPDDLPPKTPFTRTGIIALTFLTEGVAVVLALILANVFEIRLFVRSPDLLKDIIIGTSGASLPLFLFIFTLSEYAESIPFLSSLKRTLINEVRPIFANVSLTDIIAISLLAGVAEELLFRGVIQVKLGIFWTSIIFGLLHFITPAYFLIATFMGIYIGLMFDYYQSIVIPIQLHFIYDLGALIYLKYLIREKEEGN